MATPRRLGTRSQDEMAMARKARATHGLGRPGDLLTKDFFPGLTPYLRWLRPPTASLALAATAAALCGLILHPRGLLIFFGLLAMLGIGVVWPWFGVRGLTGTVAFDRERVREGEPVTLPLDLRNRLPWSAWGLQVEGVFGEPVA